MNISTTSKGSIYYEKIGDGFPLVILHAMGTDHRSMKMWLEPLFKEIQGFERIYVDLPAHGQSTITHDFRSSDDMLQNILEFINQVLPNKQFSLIGSSYGGYLAQGILHYKRDFVKSICLLAPALHIRERTLPKKVIFREESEKIMELDADIRTAFETLMVHQTEANLRIFLREIQPGRLLANKNFLMSNWREHGYFLKNAPFHDQANLSQPALIIVGKLDSICGFADHSFLLEKFTHAQLVQLEDAGHLLQIEKREEVLALIRDWIVR